MIVSKVFTTRPRTRQNTWHHLPVWRTVLKQQMKSTVIRIFQNLGNWRNYGDEPPSSHAMLAPRHHFTPFLIYHRLSDTQCTSTLCTRLYCRSHWPAFGGSFHPLLAVHFRVWPEQSEHRGQLPPTHAGSSFYHTIHHDSLLYNALIAKPLKARTVLE